MKEPQIPLIEQAREALRKFYLKQGLNDVEAEKKMEKQVAHLFGLKQPQNNTEEDAIAAFGALG